MKLEILFRSCSRIYAAHGNRRSVNAPKAEVIARCLRSLIESARIACGSNPTDYRLTVIDDHSSSDCVAQVKELLESCPFPTQFIPMSETGNGNSLMVNYEYARANATDLIYFVEDDYLHTRSAVSELVNSYQYLTAITGMDVVLFPCDYPTLYTRELVSSRIILGESRYWRHIGQTTATIFMSRKTLTDHWLHYMKMTKYDSDHSVSEANSINLVYQEVPCFSPMPSLAVHLSSPEILSPYVDWMSWWNQNQLPGHRKSQCESISEMFP